MMGLFQTKCCPIFVICFFLFSASSASTFLSDVAFGSPFVSERRLLQVKQDCPVNFEIQNYTIITNQCKGPDYSPELCCSAFKEFACPFVDYLNNATTNCALIMFSYLDRNGNYPNGLFASLCREKKEGLVCPPEPPSSPFSANDNKNSGSGIIRQLLMITIAAIVQFI